MQIFQSRLSKLVSITLMAVVTPSSGLTAECSAESGASRVALLELYTSEGCSSCPPADRWLSKLAIKGYSLERVIPLALHVDYWDYIGWKDAFAKSEFSARQRKQAAFGRLNTIYTPQVTLNGRDFQGWNIAARFDETVAAINRSTPQANLKLTAQSTAGDSVVVNVTAETTQTDNADLYLALFENRLATQVRAGENTGALLQHDYVVRAWSGPHPLDSRRLTSWQEKIALKSGWKTKDLGLAAFVQNRGNGEVQQALAMKLCF